MNKKPTINQRIEMLENTFDLIENQLDFYLESDENKELKFYLQITKEHIETIKVCIKGKL